MLFKSIKCVFSFSFSYDDKGDCIGKARFDWPLPKKLNWDLDKEVICLSVCPSI